MGFSEWFKNQADRTDVVGHASKSWFQQTGLARRGRVNAARLVSQGGLSEATAKKVIDEYQAQAA